MKKPVILMLSSLLMALAIISCKKDSANSSQGGSNAVTGTWKLVSIQANAESDVQYTDNGVVYKTVTLSNYTSTNNTGTIVFTADSMKSTNVSYTVNTTAVGYEYEDGVLLDSISSPFNVDVPSSSSAGTYKLVGTDSITYSGATFTNGGYPQASTNGSKIKINGNLMTLTTYAFKDSVIDDSGISEDHKDKATIVSTLQKQ